MFDLLILVNILVLSLDGMINESIVTWVNEMITICLVIELLMKLISQGFVRFLKHNVFFNIVVLLCFLETILEKVSE